MAGSSANILGASLSFGPPVGLTGLAQNVSVSVIAIKSVRWYAILSIFNFQKIYTKMLKLIWNLLIWKFADSKKTIQRN